MTDNATMSLSTPRWRLLLLTTLLAAGGAMAQGGAPAARPADDAPAIRALLVPAREATLSSQINGRIQSLDVSLGSAFGKGSVLIRFDCDEQQARLKMAEAELAAARENHEAKLRLQGLQQAGEVEVSVAASNAERARAQVDLNKAQVGQCVIHAPFSGRVVKLHVKSFQGTSPGMPLLDIVSDGPLKLRLNAPGKWATWLRKGTRFEVQIDETAKRYKAVVLALNGRIDAVSQTVEVEAAIDERAPELLPGMSGTARFASTPR